MTVCIAAVNPGHRLIAFATDRMVTAMSPPIEFEHTIPKLTEINTYCVALAAGDAIKGKEIFEAVRETLAKGNPTVAEIAEHVKEMYQRVRLQILEALYLRSRGLNHKLFIEHGAKLLPPVVYNQIDHAFATFALQLEVVIAGVDQAGPSIYGIRNPGLLDCYNPIGFHAIGSGAMHALGSLIETYRTNVSPVETMYSVFRAKKVAQVAPGVGEDTDLGIIDSEQEIKDFAKDDELISKFTELHQEEKSIRQGLIARSGLDKLDIRRDSRASEPSGGDTKPVGGQTEEE